MMSLVIADPIQEGCRCGAPMTSRRGGGGSSARRFRPTPPLEIYSSPSLAP
ncbi:MAG: hypothetical protein M0031_03310 [Thermaerobacter sp.]|nr:hypothetical protein [Thermaerobacter sp.]